MNSFQAACTLAALLLLPLTYRISHSRPPRQTQRNPGEVASLPGASGFFDETQ